MADFKRGDRVRLVYTNDEYTRLQSGAEGTVVYLSEFMGKRVVDVKWDSGSGLSMLIDEGDAIALVR